MNVPTAIIANLLGAAISLFACLFIAFLLAKAVFVPLFGIPIGGLLLLLFFSAELVTLFIVFNNAAKQK